MSDEASNEPIPIGEPATVIEVPESSPVESISTSAEVAPLEQTAQIPVNEPISKGEEAKIEPEAPKIEQPTPMEIQEVVKPTFTGLLIKAREVIQFRKRKKLEKIMSMFDKNHIVSNDQVEKLLHVSDATVTRYLSILEREGKIKKSVSKGSKTSYIKI